ncbi:hypothetical protein KY317_02405 [Candidatus Woesearchaeota archaeon]|nr:hypothetical protein [Candidatus Woesearchaeota archaeon]
MPEEFLPHETLNHIKNELAELKKKVKKTSSKDVKSAMINLSESINTLLDLFKQAAEGAEQEESAEKQLINKVSALERELAELKGTVKRPVHRIISPPKLSPPIRKPFSKPMAQPFMPRQFPKPPAFPKPPRQFPRPLTPPPMRFMPKQKQFPRPPSLPPKPKPFPMKIQPMPQRQIRPASPLRPPIPPGPRPQPLQRFEEPIPTIRLEEEPPKKAGFFSKLFRKKKK